MRVSMLFTQFTLSSLAILYLSSQNLPFCDALLHNGSQLKLSRNMQRRLQSLNLKDKFRSDQDDQKDKIVEGTFLQSDGALVGEDSAAFNIQEQSLTAWAQFAVAVSAVLGGIFYAWIYNGGPQLGERYNSAMEQLAGGDSTLAITYMLGFFAFCHSGLASLRPYAEKLTGPRVWRYIFAIVSLPLAFSSIVYFINHRYDGVQLWDLRMVPGMHDAVWWTSLVSFLFLYPSTFNLLEIAAVEEPTLHLWETGIARITRHPQMVGQLLWCAAHTAYIGTSFMCATSAMLCAHHLFAVWNGDRRLQDKFGDKAEIIRARTSVVPFAAIIDGRAKLPDNYVTKELLRLPYVTIVAGSVVAYYAHPFMQAGAALMGY